MALEGAFRTEKAGGLVDAIVGDSEDSIVGCIKKRSGFGSLKSFGLVLNLVNNPAHCILVGHTRTNTCQPPGFAWFGKTHQFQSPVPVFGNFYLWSLSNILLLMAKY
jgi:hypothetical protein